MRKSLVIKGEIAKLVEGQMLVICTSCGNPDHGQYAPLSELEAYVVGSFEEASAACRSYIQMWDLGGGNWNGGDIYSKEGVAIAEVSYNGRVWKKQKGIRDINNEILLEASTVQTFADHFKAKYDKMVDEYMASF